MNKNRRGQLAIAVAIAITCLLAACASRGQSAPSSYQDAVAKWSSLEQINSWIGESFTYDHDRAARLSETQRARSGRITIAIVSTAASAHTTALLAVTRNMTMVLHRSISRMLCAITDMHLLSMFAPTS